MSICILRNKDRSSQGKNAVVIALLSKSPNLSVCMILSKEIGLVVECKLIISVSISSINLLTVLLIPYVNVVIALSFLF